MFEFTNKFTVRRTEHFFQSDHIIYENKTSDIFCKYKFVNFYNENVNMKNILQPDAK